MYTFSHPGAFSFSIGREEGKIIHLVNEYFLLNCCCCVSELNQQLTPQLQLGAGTEFRSCGTVI